MAYKKKMYVKGKRPYIKKRKPKNKMLMKQVANQVIKTINKTRETKRLDVQVDEKQITVPGQGLILNNLANDGIYNYMSVGTGASARIGDQIHPVGIDLKGWMRFTSAVNPAFLSDCKVRLICGYVDDITYASARSSMTSVNWFWNGQGTVYSNDYKDITRSLNYRVINPIMDRTYTMAPTTQYNGSTVQTFPSNFTNLKTLRIKHRFGKKMELQKSQLATEACWQKNNLIILTFIRLASDDTYVSPTNLEFVMEGGFYYQDS